VIIVFDNIKLELIELDGILINGMKEYSNVPYYKLLIDWNILNVIDEFGLVVTGVVIFIISNCNYVPNVKLLVYFIL